MSVMMNTATEEFPAKASISTRTVRLPWRLFVSFLVALDLAMVTATFLLADLVFHRLVFDGPSQPLDAAMLGAAAGIAVTVTLAFMRAYTQRTLTSVKKHVTVFARAWVLAFFLIGWFAFLTKSTGSLSRGTVTTAFLLGFALVFPLRILILEILRRRIARARIALRTAFVLHAGQSEQAPQLLEHLSAQGVEVVDHVLLGEGGGRDADRLVAGVAVCVAALARRRYDAVYVFLPWSDLEDFERMRPILSRIAVPVYLFADGRAGAVLQGRALDTGSMVAFEIQRAPLGQLERVQKRVLDVTVASAALFLLAPLLLFVAVAIMFESGSPVLFKQTRRGFGGRVFRIFKFRTMTVCEDGPQIRQAQRQDSRVTPLGRVLRRTSIDELPQLLNVLRGEMSLVGPRPHALAHDTFYGALIDAYAFRHHVKPGLTGWAQVCGFRGETAEIADMDARVRHDLWYIEKWSIGLDIKILMQTAAMILVDKRAY